MKRLMIIILTAFVCISINAQLFTKLDLLTPHYYPGEVYFSDGHSEAFDEVELPRVGKSKLSVKKNLSDKERTQIDAVDIFLIKIWHKDFPDKVHILYSIVADKALMQDGYQWGEPMAMSDWGVVFRCEQNYKIDKKTGDLNFIKFRGGNGPDTPTLYYLKRLDWTKAQLLAVNFIWAKKKRVAEFFKANSTIFNGIKSDKLYMTDIQYILDEMAGGKKAEAPASNGKMGDDE